MSTSYENKELVNMWYKRLQLVKSHEEVEVVRKIPGDIIGRFIDYEYFLIKYKFFTDSLRLLDD